MFGEFLKTVAELEAKGELFAVATVVRCLPPSSGKPGDKAIIYADGKLWGWIGGGCAQPVVIREALKALAEGKPRLVRISPSPSGVEEGIVDYTMTCHSGGSLDIYIEPVLGKPHLIVLGSSPVAEKLAKLAAEAGYEVRAVGRGDAAEIDRTKALPAADYNLAGAGVTSTSLIVVSTQGDGDEEALEAALESAAQYIGFVASRTKAGKLFDYLKSKGVSPEKIRRVRAPAGLDIGARSPEEIAVSILAQLIEVRNRGAAAGKKAAALPVLHGEARLEARDPVCGMSVDPADSRHRTEYEGTVVYFCCAGCKQAFEKEPSRYAGAGTIP